MPEYVKVADLDDVIRNALDGVGYRRADIEVKTVTQMQLGGQAYGDGYQAFTVLINLSTRECHTERGSWGGRNMFDRTSPMDNDERQYELPADGVVIKGQRGGGRPVSAQLYIPAAMRSRVLPAGPSESLTKLQIETLSIYKGTSPGYRRQCLERAGVTEAIITSLVDMGLLSRNRAGAVQITTDGKNALGRVAC